MAVQLQGTGGLFTRLGYIGRLINQINANQSGQAVVDIGLIAAQFDGDRKLVDTLQTALANHQAAMLGLGSFVRSLAQDTVVEMVNLDNPQAEGSLQTAMAELINQMVTSGDTVEASTAAVNILPWSGNNNNAAVVVSLHNKRGLRLQNPFAEDVVLTCVTDSQEGAAALGSESLQALGELAENNSLNYRWPMGSGSSANLTAINADLDNAGGQLLVNGSFDSHATTSPQPVTHWVYEAGSSQISTDLSVGVCVSTGALHFTGDGATHTAISQQFGDSIHGTGALLYPWRQYAANLWLAVNHVPAAGALTVELIDTSTGLVLLDDEGNPNAFVVDLTTAHTSCLPVGDAFRTPRALPASLKLRLRLSTPLSVGTTLTIDHVGFGQMNELYGGGPSVAVFSANYALIRGDYWTLRFTNDRLGEWQTMFQRLFDINSMRLQLPTAFAMTGPTIDDSILAIP